MIEAGESLMKTMRRMNEAHDRFIEDVRKRPAKGTGKTGGLLRFIYDNQDKFNSKFNSKDDVLTSEKFEKFLMDVFKP